MGRPVKQGRGPSELVLNQLGLSTGPDWQAQQTIAKRGLGDRLNRVNLPESVYDGLVSPTRPNSQHLSRLIVPASPRVQGADKGMSSVQHRTAVSGDHSPTSLDLPAAALRSSTPALH